MVAPLIVGAARVAKGVSKATVRAKRRSKASATRPELLRRVRSRERRKNKEQATLTDIERNAQIARSKKLLPGSLSNNKSVGGNNANIKKIKAAVASNFIFWTAITFYIPQLSLWILGMSALSLESVPVLGYVIPGESLYLISWLIIVIIGIGTMIYATFIFTLRGIPCFDGWPGFVFICCIAGYCVVLVNFLPFFIFWLFTVTLCQRE